MSQGVSNHQPHDCLRNRLFWHRSKKTSRLRVTGFCEGNSRVTGELPTQKVSNAENDVNITTIDNHQPRHYLFNGLFRLRTNGD